MRTTLSAKMDQSKPLILLWDLSLAQSSALTKTSTFRLLMTRFWSWIPTGAKWVRKRLRSGRLFMRTLILRTTNLRSNAHFKNLKAAWFGLSLLGESTMSSLHRWLLFFKRKNLTCSGILDSNGTPGLLLPWAAHYLGSSLSSNF